MRDIDSYFSTFADRPLFHYTGIRSLENICRTDLIWASNAYFLNDSKEIVHACDILESLVTPGEAFNGVSDQERECLVQFRRWAQIFKNEPSDLFIFSLSDRGSLLSQWRSYTPHGKGVSIGFAEEAIAAITEKPNVRLGKCIYDRREQEEVLFFLVEKMLITFRHLRPDSSLSSPHLDDCYFPFFEQFRENILQVLALIKHEAFREEGEWRLISYVNTHLRSRVIKHRVGASMLVPYIELGLWNEFPKFKNVILGPSERETLSMWALRDFLAISNICTTVEYSGIPYREW